MKNVCYTIERVCESSFGRNIGHDRELDLISVFGEESSQPLCAGLTSYCDAKSISCIEPQNLRIDRLRY